MLNVIHPGFRKTVRHLRQQSDLLVNVGCGAQGLPGWVNLDLFRETNVTLMFDGRTHLPFRDASCRGIHCEHILEHLNQVDEVPRFLQECRRCLQPDGILRVIVPDIAFWINAYLNPDVTVEHMVTDFLKLKHAVEHFRCKMDVLNHIFHQDGQHYGGYDAESLTIQLQLAGFTRIQQWNWGMGNFPGGPIDAKRHRLHSLYFEAHV